VVCADVNVLWENINTKGKHRSSVRLDSSKKVALEVNAELVAGCKLLNDTVNI
jgi:hypothetical protein